MSLNISSRANSNELNGVAGNVISLIRKSAVNDATLGVLTTRLESDNQNLTKSLNKKTGSDLTDDLWHLESERDRGLKCFFYTLYGTTFHSDAQISDAAIRLYDVIKRHGRSMYNLPMSEQSSKMDSLFDELSRENLVAALTTTNTTVLLEDAKSLDQQFRDMLAARSQEESEVEETIHIREARKLIRADIDKIISYLETMSVVSEDEGIEKLYEELTGIIADANAIIKSRITRRANQEAGA